MMNQKMLEGLRLILEGVIEAQEASEEPTTVTATTTKKTATKKKGTEQEPTSAVEEQAEGPVTLEQIRSVLQVKRAEGKKDKFKELFSQFGVQRLPDVDPADYEKLLSAAETL